MPEEIPEKICSRKLFHDRNGRLFGMKIHPRDLPLNIFHRSWVLDKSDNYIEDACQRNNLYWHRYKAWPKTNPDKDDTG